MELQEYFFVPPRTEFLFYFFIGSLAGGMGKGLEAILSSAAYLLIPQSQSLSQSNPDPVLNLDSASALALDPSSSFVNMKSKRNNDPHILYGSSHDANVNVNILDGHVVVEDKKGKKYSNVTANVSKNIDERGADINIFRNIVIGIMEGGVLFSSYRLSIYLFNTIIPEDLNKQLYFELLYRKFVLENFS